MQKQNREALVVLMLILASFALTGLTLMATAALLALLLFGAWNITADLFFLERLTFAQAFFIALFSMSLANLFRRR